VSANDYTLERLTFVRDYLKKTQVRWRSVTSQSRLSKAWASSVMDIDKAPGPALKQAQALLTKAWSRNASGKLEEAMTTLGQAEDEVDAAWDILNRYARAL